MLAVGKTLFDLGVGGGQSKFLNSHHDSLFGQKVTNYLFEKKEKTCAPPMQAVVVRKVLLIFPAFLILNLGQLSLEPRKTGNYSYDDLP